MPEIHESVASFLSALTSGLAELLSQAGPEPAKVSWAPRATATFRPDLLWWSCGVSVDPACTFLVGAPDETWSEMGRDSGAGSSGGDPEGNCFAAIAQVIQQLAESRFGAEVLCSDMGPAEQPSDAWTSVEMAVSLGNRSLPPMDIVLSPELVTALGGQAEPAQVPPPAVSSKPMNPLDMLMHVEVPVSVSLGRTQMRVKDLLSLTQGSIVELDQELTDEVEVRVNNCVIAHGEVVAVDGNYGVRILKIVSDGSARNIGALSGPAVQRTGRN